MVLYYQCQSGISGERNLGALIDLGVPKEYFIDKFNHLGLNGFEVDVHKDENQNILGTKVDVICNEPYDNMILSDICNIIDSSALSNYVKDLSKKIFYTAAQAEAKVNNKEMENISLNDLGTASSLVYVIGAAICLEYLNVDKIFTSKIELGGGFVKSSNGYHSVPSVATSEIIKNYCISLNGVDFEATTAIGASIIKTVSNGEVDNINMKICKTGVGVGSAISKYPNVLKVYLGKIECNEESYLIESNIDDMNPEYYGNIMEDLFSLGVQDAFITPIYMKKGRPAVTLSALSSVDKKDEIIDYILRNTSTLGVRIFTVTKEHVDKIDFTDIKTKYGEIKVKNAYMGGEKIKSKFEYDSLHKLAKCNNMSVYQQYHKLMKSISEDDYKLL